MFVPGLNCWCIFFCIWRDQSVDQWKDHRMENALWWRQRPQSRAGREPMPQLAKPGETYLATSQFMFCFILPDCQRQYVIPGYALQTCAEGWDYISKVLTLTVSVWGRGRLIPLLPASKGWNPRGHIVWFFTATNYLAFKLLIILSVCNICIISHSPEDDHDWCPPGFGFRLLRQALTNNACTYCSCVLLTESHKISQFGHDHYWGWFTSFSDDCIWSRFGF